MPEQYKQVVNLQSKKIEKNEKPFERSEPLFTKTIVKKKSRAEGIDQVYSDTSSDNIIKELSQIEKPRAKKDLSVVYKQTFILLLVFFVALSVYLFFKNQKNIKVNADKNVNIEKQAGRWYSVQLINQEMYYGFIKDTGTDPVVLENVYYNYSQVVQPGETKTEENSAGNIRLVKRGQEAHGPNGTMEIIRSQVILMEPLSDESKILKAILDHEK